jgi:hypothetical protein
VISPYEVKLAAMFIGTSAGVVVTGIVAWTVVKLRRPTTPAAPPAGELQALHDRLARIEDAVESVALELERGSEAQRFTARLLAERVGEVPPRGSQRASGQHRSTNTPH